jgi:tetratricopeptide (TPR) repeat protein
MVTEDCKCLHRSLVHVIVILLLGIVIYWNSMSVPFTFDDKPNIANNPVIKNFSLLLDSAQFKCDLLDPKLKPAIASRIVGYFTFFVNYKFHGLSVLGYHLVNIGIHLLNSLLVYFIVFLLYQKISESKLNINDKYTDTPELLALFSALLFVSHPIQTEAVTYIVQRFTSLATLFYLLSVAGYLKFRLSEKVSGTRLLYLGAFISAILAMKTKEFSFTLPLVLTLIEFMFIKSEVWKRIRCLAPFYLLLAVIPLTLLASALVLGDRVTVSSFEFGSSSGISRGDYFITQLTVIVKYLGLLLPPVIQNLDYDYPLYHSFFDLKVFGAAALLGFLLSLGFYLLKVSKRASWYAKHGHFISFGIFWFFITIAAESSIIRIKDLVFEHRLYLPSIGLFIAATSSVMALKEALHRRASSLEKLIAPCAIFIILLLSFATYARNIVWQDEIRLWQDTVAKSPNKPRAHDNLALAYYDSGFYQEALEENFISLKLKPDPAIHLNIGNIYLRQKRFEEAISEFEASIALKPDFEKAFNGMCNVYYNQKRYSEAIKACETAVKLKKDYAEAHNMLGMIAFDQGDLKGALKYFNTAISSKPDFAIAHNNAGNAYFEMKNYDASLKEYHIVSLLERNYIGVHLSIGKIYHETGRFDDAVLEYQLALKQKPDYSEALKLLEISQREIAGKNGN